jgi:uncharacterized membrane protein
MGMARLSTAAWIAHDLGMATGIGGGLFGRAALHPAVERVSDRHERGQVISDAWRRFNWLELAGYALAAVTWFAGRSRLGGREVDSGSRGLVLAKDGLMAATVATAVGSSIAGRMMSAPEPRGVPMASGDDLAQDAPEQSKKLHPVVNALGIANILCAAGVAGITTVLAMRAGQSHRWSFVSHFLK